MTLQVHGGWLIIDGRGSKRSRVYERLAYLKAVLTKATKRPGNADWRIVQVYYEIPKVAE